MVVIVSDCERDHGFESDINCSDSGKKESNVMMKKTQVVVEDTDGGRRNRL